MPTALALSPHLDDAAFSCGGTLARLASAGWRVVVATLFTRSMPDPQGFALACQLDKGLDAATDYMALRRAEDADACARLGAEPRWLPFAEAPHRGYDCLAALFGPVLPDDPAAAPLTDAIGDLLDALRPDLLLAPQAIGAHVDHVVAVRALRAAASSTPLLWWQDYPYIARAGTVPVPFGTEMSALPALTVEILPEPKHAACLAYASQIGLQFGSSDRLSAALADAGPRESFRRDRLHTIPDALLGAAS
jgi:LmbE family N-acetylglucosaminyl deacetylase